MATPGYPQMGQMPPMGGPHGPNPMMMGGGPTMGMRPIRRGTSKAVPVVVSAGLAVGVFCGLLFGVGTGKKNANAAPVVASNVKKEVEAKPEPGAAPAGLGATSATPNTPAKPATPATGSGAATAPTPTTPTTPTTPAKPEEKKIKLTVKIKPEAAQKDAKVSIDDKDIDGMIADIPSDKKTVKVEVKSNGYHSYEKKLDLVGDSDMTLEIELTKRPSGGTGTGGVHPPKRPDRPPSGGGLIDI